MTAPNAPSVRRVLTRVGYWLRPYDAVLDGRRWRWKPSGCRQQREHLSRPEVRAWLKEQLGAEYDTTPLGTRVAMENTLYEKQPGVPE